MELNPPPIIHPFYGPLPPLFYLTDHHRSISLVQYMVDQGLVPSSEEERKRRRIVSKLKQVIMQWVKEVARGHKLQREQIECTSATLLTYGSYGLGIHSSESDIDALCVAPFFASIAEDFFVVLHHMLQRRIEVTDIQCVKRAKVPLMRFKFDGISIDLPFARLSTLYVPENVDVRNPFFTWNIDSTSWKSLSGVVANKYILNLVPNIETFRSMLRCLKLWAKRRGVYGNLLGYLGGVHMTVLAAHVCRRHPGASLNTLIIKFFQTFALWPWPEPVTVQEGMFVAASAIQTWSFMPICLPSTTYQLCHSNITKSTFFRIKTEFLRGHSMTSDLLKPNFIWDEIFEPFPYSKNYSRFLKIYLSSVGQYAPREWVGWVKSRIRSLLLILERVQGFCDPNPTEYVDDESTESNVVFYWGLNPTNNSFRNLDLVKEEFMKIINNGYEGSAGRLKLSILLASELPKKEHIPHSLVGPVSSSGVSSSGES